MILLDKIEVSSFLHHSFDPSSFWGRHLIETGMVKNRNHWSIVVEAGVEVLDAFCRLGRALFCAHGFGCRFGWFGRTRVEINLPITRRTSSARTGLGDFWNIRIPSTKFVECFRIEHDFAPEIEHQRFGVLRGRTLISKRRFVTDSVTTQWKVPAWTIQRDFWW